MTIDLSLPAFALDCRDWLVADGGDEVLPEDIGGVPVLAVLSTALVVDDTLHSASAVLSLGLMEDDFDVFTLEPGIADSRSGVPDIHVLDTDWAAGHARFVLPAPDGELAVIAEFSSAPAPVPDLVERFRDLVSSFRWAA